MKNTYHVEKLLTKHKEIEKCLANKNQLCFYHYAEFIDRCEFIEKDFLLLNAKLIAYKKQNIDAYIAILEDLLSIIDFLYQLLGEDEKAVICGYYYNHKSMNSICQSISISTATFSRIKSKALNKMEKHYLAQIKDDKSLMYSDYLELLELYCN